MKKLLTSTVLSAVAFALQAERELQLPTVPQELQTPSERAAYIMKHFWDAMDWRDTTLTRDENFMEQNAANFYNLFNIVDSVSASNATKIMLNGASVDPKAYSTVADIARLYLFEPDSPVADEESFLVVSELLLSDNKLDDADMLRIEDARECALRNRVGHKATDFEMTDRHGNRLRLSVATSLHAKNILIFYDPDCHDCAELEHKLATSDLNDTGIIMVSPYGEQDGLWARHAASMPAEWIVALPADEEFLDKETYDIRVTPTIYVLDRNCIILKKGKADF